MTYDDLDAKLREMLETSTHGANVITTVLLFGVLFDEEIRNSESNGTRIAEGASVRHLRSKITDGQALARLGFVEPTAAMVRKWKNDR